MRGYDWLLGLVLLGVGWPGLVVGQDVDMEEVRRRAEKYEREAAEEAAKPAPAIDYDHEAWKAATECGTAACFRAYLEDYPKGRYAKMARARLESESESRPAAAERPTSPSRPVQTLLADRYRDHDDGTVTDVRTGLQWMRCSLGQTWRGRTCVGEAETYNWQAALDAADTLNRQGGYAGRQDWRVPTREELLTLIYCSSGQPTTWNNKGKSCEGDYERPTIYQSAFPNTQPIWYWSASPFAFIAGNAWYVGFLNGYDNAGGKGSNYAVRLVRGGQ